LQILLTNFFEGFTSESSGFGEPREQTGPATSGNSAQQKMVMYYDALGLSVTRSNILGEKTIISYDVEGRELGSQVLSSSGSVVRTNSIRYSADHQAVTNTVGSGTGSVITVSWTDTFGKPVLTRFGTNSFTWQQYDLVGRLISSKDELGQETKFVYDGVGRLKTNILADGAQITRLYDPAGNLTNLAMPGGLAWRAQFDSAGRQISEQLAGGGNVTRQFTNSYFNGGALHGLLEKSTDPRGITRTNLYDEWMRPTLSVWNGSLLEQKMTNQCQCL
jgi:YD repeat-containing protein